MKLLFNSVKNTSLKNEVNNLKKRSKPVTVIMNNEPSEWTKIIRFFMGNNPSLVFCISIKKQIIKKGLKSLTKSQRSSMTSIYYKIKEIK